MKTCSILLLLVCSLLSASLSALAVDPPTTAPSRIRTGVAAVQILPALQEQLEQADQAAAARRIAQTLDSQLINALQNTRKFQIIARSDLDVILQDQARTAPDRAPITPLADYLILTTLDDFVDVADSTYSPQMNIGMARRTLRISAVVKIYDARTGELAESLSVPVQIVNAGPSRILPTDQQKNHKAQDDSVYLEAANLLASRAAAQITDALFPARVIAVTGDTVTINRGAGTLPQINELWEVFAAGQLLKDPDTGEILGREETKVGEVVITDIQPRFIKARIYGDNRGIAPGNITRVKLISPESTLSVH